MRHSLGLLLLQSVLHLLGIRRGCGHRGLVQILGHLAELIEHLATLTLQLLAELLRLGQYGPHLFLELRLVLLGVSGQLRVPSLNLLDGLGNRSLDTLNGSVECARVLLGLKTKRQFGYQLLFPLK